MEMHRKYVDVGTVLAILGTFLIKKTTSKSFPDSQDEISNKSPPVIQDEAQNILRIRYAKGEITKKEYLKMKKILQK